MNVKLMTVDQLIERNAQLAADIALAHEFADEHLKKMIPWVNERMAILLEIQRRAHVKPKGEKVEVSGAS